MRYRIEFNHQKGLTSGKIRSLLEKTFDSSLVSLEEIAWDEEQSREYAIVTVGNEGVPVEFLESATEKDLWVEKILKEP